MPRRSRLELPSLALHITHRGVNRAATFLDAEDCALYRQLLHDALSAQGVALHAYVLMTNHVHLLVTPPEPGTLSRGMSRLGQRYVPASNRKHGRTDTLWEGRFKSCLVDSEHYLLTVYRYIELNPVRAAMAEAPSTIAGRACTPTLPSPTIIASPHTPATSHWPRTHKPAARPIVDGCAPHSATTTSTSFALICNRSARWDRRASMRWWRRRSIAPLR